MTRAQAGSREQARELLEHRVGVAARLRPQHVEHPRALGALAGQRPREQERDAEEDEQPEDDGGDEGDAAHGRGTVLGPG